MMQALCSSSPDRRGMVNRERRRHGGGPIPDALIIKHEAACVSTIDVLFIIIDQTRLKAWINFGCTVRHAEDVRVLVCSPCLGTEDSIPTTN